MNNDDSWEEVEVPENQEVDYEIEEEVPQEAAPQEKEEDPKELEGIQTKGAEKELDNWFVKEKNVTNRFLN